MAPDSSWPEELATINSWHRSRGWEVELDHKPKWYGTGRSNQIKDTDLTEPEQDPEAPSYSSIKDDSDEKSTSMVNSWTIESN